MFERFPLPVKKTLAWSVHFFTATGAVWGFLSLLAVFEQNWRAAILWIIVAMFVSGGANSTLTRNMFVSLRDQIDPTIAAISTVMILITSALLALSQLFGKRER